MRRNQCIYCGKLTTASNNFGEPTCETEWVCEETPAPSLQEEMGDDPTGRIDPWDGSHESDRLDIERDSVEFIINCDDFRM